MLSPPPILDEVLCEDSDVALYRARTDDGRHVLLKVLKAARPTTAEYESLRRQVELAEMAGSEVAAEPEDVTTFQGHPTLVLRDHGGTPLTRRLGQPMALGRFFPLALELARAVARVHARHLVHGELHPTDILELEDGRIELIGFGRVDCASPSIPVPRPAATRPYLSPEQSGRMWQPFDRRSDLYSVGIIFYELLAGVQPFDARDALGWIHAHCALPPPPLGARRTDLPAALPRIVEKLLAKPPEARYQSAVGLRDDLAHAFDLWRDGRGDELFTLGGTDPAPRLRLSHCIYGRTNETRRLRQALTRSPRHFPVEIVLVSGPAGIGKSALVTEALRQLTNVPELPLVATARCQRSTSRAPGAPLFDALDGLLRASLDVSTDRPDSLKRELETALGVHLPLLAALLPELKRIVGASPSPSDVIVPEYKERLVHALDALIRAFSTVARPIVLVMEDLQWSDSVTLDILTRWAADSRSPPMIVLATYRSEDVPTMHPLKDALLRLHDQHAVVGEVTLAPLGVEAVAEWLARLFRTEREEVTAFATKVHAHTGGNPLFVARLVECLHQRGRLHWDNGARRWQWDPLELGAATPHDASELIADAIRRLPPPVRSALQCLAAYGHKADAATLSLVLGTSQQDAFECLEDAFVAKLLTRSRGMVCFAHDQVAQVAYDLLGDEREAAHLKVGRALLAETARIDERIYEIVRQFELAGHALEDPDERADVAALELEAGRAAQQNTHFSSSRQFLIHGVSLLGTEPWTAHHELSFELHLALARSRVVTGEAESARELGVVLLAQARSGHQRACVYRLFAELDLIRGDLHEAIEGSIRGLKELDIELHDGRAPDATLERVLRLGPSALPENRSTVTPETRTVGELFVTLLASSMLRDVDIFDQAAAASVEHSLATGDATSAPGAYAALAVRLARIGRHGEAERLGRLAYLLATRGERSAQRPRASFIYHAALSYRALPIRTILQEMSYEIEVATSLGAQPFSCLLEIHVAHLRFFGGAPLTDVSDALSVAGGRGVCAANAALRRHIDNLRGLVARLRLTNDPQSRRDPAVDLSPFGRLDDLHREVIERFFLDDYVGSARSADLAMELAVAGVELLQVHDLAFYGALATANLTPADPAAIPARLASIAQRLATLSALAEVAPENFGARHALVCAEHARLDGDAMAAEQGYERAVHLARRDGQLHVEAIATECAARFYRARGVHTVADTQLVQAHACYESWGATGKAASLALAYPFLTRHPVLRPDTALVAEAQRAISASLRLDELSVRVIDVALEHAAAQRGCLVRVIDEKHLVLAASKGVFGELGAGVESLHLPVSMLRSACRTRKPALVADAVVDNRFAADPYFAHPPAALRSALCLPIVRDDRVIALLYLENEVAPGRFSPTTIAVLEAITAQAAISLESARRHTILEQENAARRAAEAALAKKQRLYEATLDATPLVVLIKDLEGRYLFVNRRYEEVFNIESSQLLGKTDFDLFPHEYAERYREMSARALAEDRPIEVDDTLALADGYHRYRLLKFPLRDEDGKAWGTCGIASDVTCRRRAEEELRETLSLVEATIEATQDGILVVDLDNEVVRYNRRFLEMCGLTEDQVRDKNLADVVRAVSPQLQDPDEAFERIEAIRREPELASTGTIFFKDGRVFERVLKPQWVGGTVVGRVASFHDVTDKVRATEERTRLLAEEKAARAEAEEAVRARDEFLSIASHELRTPLASLSLAVETLQQATNVQRIQRSAAIAKRQVQRIVSLVDMLLDVSRLRSGKLVLSRAVVDLRVVVDEVASLLASELARSGSKLEITAPEPVIGSFDAIRLEQVVTNLLTNAIKFGRGAPISVELTREGGGARLAVVDAGIGIPAEPRARIFEPFTRLVSSRHFGGLGLGLHISKTIVEAHGGTLEVESKEGVGSTFVVRLPLDLDVVTT